MWKRSNSKQVVRSAGITTGQCLLKSQEQHSHENTALDAGKLIIQKGAAPVLSTGTEICDFWSLLCQNELRYHHDTHHKCRCLCNASSHPPQEAVILVSFWQKNVIVLAFVRGSFTSLPSPGQNSWMGLLRAYRNLGRQPCPWVIMGVLPFVLQGNL